MKFFKVTIYLFTLVSLFVLTGRASAATNVYYSVGQNASDHSSGGDVSISSGVATFTVPQNAINLGVGDRLTADGNVYYLTSKISTSQWNVVTNLGATPGDLGSTAVTSIAHEYTSLSAAEAGAIDANHLNTADLVAGDYILNIPCYYDTGADTTAVVVDGYTTGTGNYIRIYTPNDTSTEVNHAQRHSGRWADDKYQLAPTGATTILEIYDTYHRVDGLQIYHSNNSIGNYYSIYDRLDSAWISNNIIKGTGSFTYARQGIRAGSYVVATKIWNNIVYDFSGGGSAGIGLTHGVVYNNTIYNCSYGITTLNNNNVIKNNIVQGATDGYNGTFSSSSEYNISDTSQADADEVNTVFDGYKTVPFVDADNDDFHLRSTDTVAKNNGLYDPGAGLFSTDIDGSPRDTSVNWDIGADEYTSAYRVTPALGTTRINYSQTSKMANGLVLMQSFDGPHMDWSLTLAEARDQSAQANHGNVVNGTPAAGKIGQGLEFGSTGYVDCSSTGFDPTNDFSIVAWFKTDSVATEGGNNRMVVSQTDSGGTGRSLLYIDPNTSPDTLGSYLGGTALNGLTEILTGRWYLGALTYDSSIDEVIIYTNDDGGNSTDISANPGEVNSGNLIIGAQKSMASGRWDGIIDEVRIYDRVLTSAEISDLYQLGQARFVK